MPTGVYQTSVKCPFYKHDNGQKHKITCEWLADDSCITLTFQKRLDYKIQITTFCCKHYKKCELYNILTKVKYEEE